MLTDVIKSLLSNNSGLTIKQLSQLAPCSHNHARRIVRELQKKKQAHISGYGFARVPLYRAGNKPDAVPPPLGRKALNNRAYRARKKPVKVYELPKTLNLAGLIGV